MRLSSLAFLGIIFLASCSPHLTPLTENLVEDMNWSSDELEQIQFYLSDDIVLYREAKIGDASIREGKVKVVNGRKVEQIVFEKGTPGVFLFSTSATNMAISFEEGGEKRYLVFGPSPKYSDRYVLLAKDWNRKKGQISYDDRVYQTSTQSAFAMLMIDLERARKTSVKSRKAKGRTIN